MAVTGEQVFTIAMKLMDEVMDNGQINEADTAAYKNKTPDLLTILQTELLPSAVTPVVITDLTQPLLVSDRMALLVLPYGLAAHLMLTEDATIAGFFNERYEELRKKQQTASTPIVDVYDTLNGMR